MTDQLMRVEGVFAVARPIPWDENDTLRDHVDQVIDALTETEGVVEVDSESQLDEGRVQLAIVLAGSDEDRADRMGREALAGSIRQCDGRHFQLLTESEEAAMTQIVPSRSGLLTPLWRLRTLAVGPFAKDAS